MIIAASRSEISHAEAKLSISTSSIGPSIVSLMAVAFRYRPTLS
jgi:hypothetical protein